jgi:hypothetical protein
MFHGLSVRATGRRQAETWDPLLEEHCVAVGDSEADSVGLFVDDSGDVEGQNASCIRHVSNVDVENEAMMLADA